MMSKISRYASVLALGAMVLTGCQSAKEAFAVGEAAEANPGPCPRAFALYDAARKVEFRGEEAFANVGLTAEITNVRSLCRYYGTQPIIADLEVEMAFGKGPAAATESTGSYTYWVAVTRRNVDVIEKEYFPITIDFNGSDRAFATERVNRIVIPRKGEDTSGTNFEIVVGFDLTDEQVLFNRAGKRFRPNVGE